MKPDGKVVQLTCKRCLKSWSSVSGIPKQCRWCHSPYWDQERTRAAPVKVPRLRVTDGAVIGKSPVKVVNQKVKETVYEPLED
jgi:hypothetical protein